MRAPSHILIYLSIFLLLPPVQAAPAAICPLPMFSAARSFSAPGTSWFSATADFNNDGQADIAIANFTSNTISIFLGNGDGTMQPALTFAVASGPNWIATGDFNGDGNTDMVVAANNGVYVALGNGDGTFRRAANVYSGLENTVAVADINGDGKMDIIAGAFLILLGKGDGTFQAGVQVSTYPLFDSYGGVIGDFNGDGKPDLVTADVANGNLAFLAGKGGASFGAAVISGNQSLNGSFIAMASADFNGDGHLDIVALNSFDKYVQVWIGNGDGTFKTPVNYTVGPTPSSVAIADFNRDGSPDLAVVSESGTTPEVSILLGSGSGVFHPAVNIVPTGNAIKSVAIADFNGDGKFDLAIAAQSVGAFVVLGNGDGTFQTATDYATGSGSAPNPQNAAIGDLNGDGIPDVAIANNGSNSVGVLIGNGDGTFKPLVNYPGPAGGGTTGIALADFNGDNHLDIVVANVATLNISLFINNGDGTFRPRTDIPVQFGALNLAVGDFNKDGHQDVAALSLLGVVVLLGKGDGTFQVSGTYGSGLGGPQANLVAADLNNDGKLDLAVADSATNNISVLLGNGNGSFSNSVNYKADTNNSVQTLAVGDLNGDGIPDIAVATLGCNPCLQGTPGGNVSVLTGKGGGTFNSPVTYSLPYGLQGIAIADFNGDGAADVVVTNFITSGVAVMLNAGNGTLQAPYFFGAGNGTLSVAVGDLNGDGKPDIVALNGGSNNASILLNNCACTGSTCYGITSVVNGATFLEGFAAGQWISIEGKNLSSGAPQVLNFVNGVYPLQANGVTVTVGGQPAPLWYLSPNSLNVIAPDLTSPGPVDVVVTNNGNPTNTAKGRLEPYSPALFAWPGGYAVATDANFSFKVKNGTFPGFPTTPAAPGSIVILWGTGFGPSNPPVAAGHQVPADQTYNIAAPVQVSIGGVQAQFIGAAMASGYAALTQVAVYVPANLANGDYPVVVTAGGISSTNEIMLTVQK